MRNTLISTIAVAVALAACDRSAPPAEMPCVAPSSSPIDSSTRAQVVEAREAVWRAYYAGDSARLAELLPERMVGMGQDRAGIIADAQESARSGTRLLDIGFTCDEFFLSGDVAVVYSNYVTSMERGGKRSEEAGRAIELFERRDGKWINPSWHLDQAR